MMNKHYSLTITLLEDLHTGTGTGNTIVDAVQARDEQGFPIIDRHHFRGVLKDNAKRLAHLRVINNEDIIELFGIEGGKQRKLDCSSLRTKEKDRFIFWDSTAREKDSRCPEENSLRRIEYIKAGTKLTGTVTLMDVSEQDIKNFEIILKFTTRLGSERTRGSGQIKIEDPNRGVQTGRKRAKTLFPVGSHSFQVLLKAEEPLCIPTSGHAGNIIRTESYISGRILFAAICAKAYQTGSDKALKELFSNELQIGNAYPIPETYKDQNLQSIQVFPMPNNIHSIKQAKDKDTDIPSYWPHWAKPSKQTGLATELKKGMDIDLFEEKTDDKTNRPKGAIYLFKDNDNKWRRYQQALTIRMRNQRGDPLATDTKRKDTELFSEQRIPAGTYFMLEVNCNNIALLNKVAAYLSVSNQLLIGRSKAPISVQAQQLCSTKLATKDKGDKLTITATSDWIIRSENLGYFTSLNLITLSKAFEISPEPSIKLKAHYQETETHGSFNFATRLPKRPFEVIRRGSCFQLTGKATEIKKLYTKLSSKSTAIGERTTEGYGQFIINLDIEFTVNSSESTTEEEPNTQDSLPNETKIPETKSVEETVIDPRLDKTTAEKIKEECHDYWKIFKENIKSPPPSPEEWKKLKEDLIAEENRAYLIIIQKANSNYLYNDQMGDNLGQKLSQWVNNYDDHKAAVSLFLTELEQYIYMGEES